MLHKQLDPRALIQWLIGKVWAAETSENATETARAISTLANASAHIARTEAREQEAVYGA